MGYLGLPALASLMSFWMASSVELRKGRILFSSLAPFLPPAVFRIPSAMRLGLACAMHASCHQSTPPIQHGLGLRGALMIQVPSLSGLAILTVGGNGLEPETLGKPRQNRSNPLCPDQKDQGGEKS